jgi:hypothetical protein
MPILPRPGGGSTPVNDDDTNDWADHHLVSLVAAAEAHTDADPVKFPP